MSSNTRLALLHIAIFVAVLGGLTLTSWNLWQEPSPHFHFIDLAESFMAGRVDTETPMRRKGGQELPGDPEGLQEAVDRALSSGGWNDWVSYYEVVLESGEMFKGVWPWKQRRKGESGYDVRDRFMLLDGNWVEFNERKDIRSTCVAPPEIDPKDQVARAAWKTRDRYPAERTACENVDPEESSPRICPAGEQRVRCKQTRNFISFPPFPAVVMLPFVAVWHYHFNDVLFTLIIAALSALMMFVLMRRFRELNYTTRSNRDFLVLVFLFAFGTVAYFSSIRGSVWFTALVIGTFLNILYLYFATDLKSPFLAGLFLALGFATRTPQLFASVYFFLLVGLQKQAWDKEGFLLRVKQVALFAIPCLIVGISLMLYNHARFDSYTEFGHRFLASGTRRSIVDHGMFAFWFLPKNLAAAFTNVPQFLSTAPFVKITGHGISLLAATPVFFYLFWPKRERVNEVSMERYRWPLHRILWVTIAATALPGLFYQNTGWFQFSYRFAMDYLPMLVLLLALDERRRNWLFYTLVGVSVAVNLFGAVTFNRFGQFYY